MLIQLKLYCASRLIPHGICGWYSHNGPNFFTLNNGVTASNRAAAKGSGLKAGLAACVFLPFNKCLIRYLLAQRFAQKQPICAYGLCLNFLHQSYQNFLLLSIQGIAFT